MLILFCVIPVTKVFLLHVIKTCGKWIFTYLLHLTSPGSFLNVQTYLETSARSLRNYVEVHKELRNF